MTGCTRTTGPLSLVLCAGHAASIVAELDQRLASTARTGPGNKPGRDKVNEIRNHIHKRLPHRIYGELRRQGLELSTGPVEGVIKNIRYPG